VFKRGVTERGKFAQYALAKERAHRGWWPFAYTLLEELQDNWRPEDEVLLERIYSSVAGGEGVYKFTKRHRLTMLDEKLFKECNLQLPGITPLVIHDIGVSNGITSLELYERFSRGRDITLYATDYYDRLYFVDVPNTVWTIVFDTKGTPLQFVSNYFVLSAQSMPPYRYPVNRAVQRYVMSKILPRALALLDDQSDSVKRTAVRTVPLFHPMCLDIAKQNRKFVLGRHNAFEPNPIPCHVIRAMNLLTRKHLATVNIREALRACSYNLAENGYLILGRTIDEDDGRIAATAFVRKVNRFVLGWRLNEGYEHEDLVEQLRLDPTACQVSVKHTSTD